MQDHSPRSAAPALNIVLKKDGTEKSVHIADIHIKQRIKAQDISKEQIDQKPGKEADKHSFFFSTHKSKRRHCHNQKIWRNRSKRKCLKHCRLQQKAYHNNYGYNYFTSHKLPLVCLFFALIYCPESSPETSSFLSRMTKLPECVQNQQPV